MCKACDACLTNSKRKMDKTCENLPQDPVSMMPGEELSVDFCDVFSKSVLVVCDRVTSHIYAEVTKDKSFESAKGVMMTYFHTYGLPYKISSDGGPSFRNKWMAWLDKMSITSHITSAYRSESKGLVERSIGKLKASAERIGEINPTILLKVLFEINVTPTQDLTGSPASKFFGRVWSWYKIFPSKLCG